MLHRPFIFFLMNRRPPRPPLFPYPTPFGSRAGVEARWAPRRGHLPQPRGPDRQTVPEGAQRRSPRRLAPPAGPCRSEEHTSELQSRQYLVCRLLLEKKKSQKHKHVTFHTAL